MQFNYDWRMNATTTSTKNAAIVGANGYTGIELKKLLARHPYVTLKAVFNRSIADHEKAMSHHAISNYTFEELPALAAEFDVIFLATPADISMSLVALIFKQCKLIIDLSGAFRLSSDVFSEWYEKPHTAKDHIQEARYGLSPWSHQLQDHDFKSKRLIANPGCYATAVLMAILPLLKNQIINTNDRMIIDAKSGVSGAGKNPKFPLMYCEMSDNFYPYKIGKHQHIPEIKEHALALTNIKINPLLITHLLPIKRGLQASIYVTINEKLDINNQQHVIQKVHDAYHNAYQNYPLVTHGAIDSKQDDAHNQISSLKTVIHSTKTHISYYLLQNQLIIFSCIDNLLKGAASQAIENLNYFYNYPISMGLTAWEI